MRVGKAGFDMRLWFLPMIAAAWTVSGCDNGAKKPMAELETVTDSPSSTNLISQNDPSSEKPQSVKFDTTSNSLTPSQINATRSAEQYLSMSGFSRVGLIGQLSSDAGDGYSVVDAKAAVDSLSVDWDENAAKSAKQYLDISGFSCKGLIEQLSSSAGDKYTVAQATYGARAAGAC